MDHAAPSEFPAPAPTFCPHAPECPGCPLIELAYPAQLAQKQLLVRAQFAAYPELAGIMPAATPPATRLQGYRTRAKLVAGSGALGLFARGTHRVVDIPHCRVLDPLVAEVVAALRGLLAAGPALDGVDVARVGDALLVTLIAPPATAENGLRGTADALQRADALQLADALPLADALREAVPAVAGVALSRREPGAVQLLGAGHALLRGVSELREQPNAEQPYAYVALGAFMQAHADTAQAIHARVLEHLAAPSLRGLRVLELFAGSGALSLLLAAGGAQVTAVESFAPACERLQRAAREQSLAVRVVVADAAAHTRALLDAKQCFDVVLVNPPRRGLEPALRTRLAALAAPQLGYISCRPSSLTRDLAHFARLGYVCSSAAPFDMMPLTDQVETLAWLVRGEAPAPSLIHEDAQLLALHKAAHESVEALRARLRRLPGCEQACALSALATTSSGLVLFGRTQAEAASVGEPPWETLWSFVALVKGVVRERGSLPGASTARYRRLAVVAGHSLVRVESPSDAHVLLAFRRLGHPLVGDPRERATAKHFALRHGLDRPFLHASSALRRLAERSLALRAGLAPDLAGVLDSMGGSALAQTV
jgi:23S rRNA (uracil1939-C5)-methyltransferase